VEYLQKLLTRCREEGIAILVLPELRMPPNFVQSVAEFLRNQTWSELRNGKGLLLVVAGSWHVREATGQKWVNRAQILDYMGRRIWEHDKLARYHVTPENLVGDAGDLLRRCFGLNDDGGVEGIELGHELQFCDTSIGRIAAAICVGFFHKPLEDLLTRSRAEIFLVPAMSPTTAATFVANCGTTGKAKSGASFYQTALRRGAVVMETGSEEQVHTFHFQFTKA
jgi:predicted amidohydrolase